MNSNYELSNKKLNLKLNETLNNKNSIESPSINPTDNKNLNTLDFTNEDFNNINLDNQNKYQQFQLIYSPRTTYSNDLEYQEQLFNDLTLNFDPITIKIIKKHFKERLGSLYINQFIAILKNHLLSWHPEINNREKVLIKLLHRLFQEIDLNNNGSMEWSEFCNYIIHNSNNLASQVAGETKAINNSNYKNKFYSLSKTIIDTKDFAETISNMFYIEKFNLIGIIEEGKSIIHFIDATTNKKCKNFIDIKNIQRDLDLYDQKELNNRMRKKAKELKKKKAAAAMLNSNNCNSNSNLSNNRNFFSNLNLNKSNIINSVEKNHQSNLDINNKMMSTKKIKYNYNSDSSSNSKYKSKGKRNKGMNKIQNKEDIVIHESYRKVGILTTLFIQEYDLLLVSQTNKKITAWRYIGGDFKNDNNMKYFSNDKSHVAFEIIITELPQYCMTWDSINKHLYTGQEDGKIHKWDLFKSHSLGVLDCDSILSENEKCEKEKKKKSAMFVNEHKDGNGSNIKKIVNFGSKESKSINKLKSKVNYESRDFVTSLLIINKIQVLAASYLNGKIILWDTLLMNIRKQYKNKLKTGIYHIVYDSSKNLIFSCGFDSKIMVYDPYIESEIYTLPGHMVSISNMVINQKENELISYDITGNIRIWDTNSFVCTQSISPYEGDYSISEYRKKKKNFKTKSNIILVKKSKKIMCFKKHNIKILEIDKSLNPNLCDDHVVFSSYYDIISKIIITVCLRKIKMWNPFTGKISKVYEDPMKGEITALVMDSSYKRIFLGDNNGNIKCFNLKNGKFLKDLDSHDNSEISFLIHSQLLEKVISASIDNTIKIHDDKELNESLLIKEFKILNYNIKSMVLMENLTRLVIGLSSGICKFYDIEHYRYDSDLNNTDTMRDDITAIYQFNNFIPKFFEINYLNNNYTKLSKDRDNNLSSKSNICISSNKLNKVSEDANNNINLLEYFEKDNVDSSNINYKEKNVKRSANSKNKVEFENDSFIKYYNIIITAHASGKCKLMWTPPSNLKFNTIYEFVHLNIAEDDSEVMRGEKAILNNKEIKNSDINISNNIQTSNSKFTTTLNKLNKDEDNKSNNINDSNNSNKKNINIYGNHTPISCLEFDYENYRLFTGDQLGNIRCYDFSNIFKRIDEFLEAGVRNNSLIEQDIYNYKTDKGYIKAHTIWYVEAHKESIKHLHYAMINPNVILSTSHDLRVKLYKANTGEYIDDLKQGSNKIHSVPIGIKYKGVDPITKIPYEKTVFRENIKSNNINDLENIQENNIEDYSEKISIYNAKEKLLSYVKNSKISDLTKSNTWNLNIIINDLKKSDIEEMNKTYKIVKKNEELILKTELMMQENSIYSDSYQPLFIKDMDEQNIKEFSKILNQKLRHVKLAISKANIGQSKFKSENEQNTVVENYITKNNSCINDLSISKKNNLESKHTKDNALSDILKNNDILENYNKDNNQNKDEFIKNLNEQCEINKENVKELNKKILDIQDKDSVNNKKKFDLINCLKTKINKIELNTLKYKNIINYSNFGKNYQKYSSAVNSKLPVILNERLNNKLSNVDSYKEENLLAIRSNANKYNYKSINKNYKFDLLSDNQKFEKSLNEYNECLNSLVIDRFFKIPKIAKKNYYTLSKIIMSKNSQSNNLNLINSNHRLSEEYSYYDSPKRI